MDIQQPYKFAESASAELPQQVNAAIYFRRLEKGELLNRDEKDQLFQLLCGNTGKTNYKVLGWVFPFGQFFKKYLVKYKHDPDIWREICAPDKTAIRNCYYTNSGIVKIIDLPE